MATDPTADGQAEASAGQADDDRGISVGRDASGNAFVTGDNNNVKVVIYQSVAERREQEEPRSVEIGPNPYMGLLAFHEEDADRFFGREQQIGLLWEKLRDLQHGSTAGRGQPRLLPILGPSGCGKTTLLNVMGTLDKPSAGAVAFKGRDLLALGKNEIAKFRNQEIGFVFQLHHLLPHCSVLENVLVPTLLKHYTPEIGERANRLLERVAHRHRLRHGQPEMGRSAPRRDRPGPG